MTRKHTPGPWKACRRHEDFNGTYYDLEDGDELPPFTSIESANGVIFNAHDCCEIEEANAHLIAAAPELLAALEKVLMAHDYDGAMTIGNAVLSPAIHGMVRRTINKAKGITE